MNISIDGVIRPYTKEELEQLKAIETPKEIIIGDLKNNLDDTDYKTLKITEKIMPVICSVISLFIKSGEFPDELKEDATKVLNLIEKEYISELEQRQEWRDKINELQKVESEEQTDG